MQGLRTSRTQCGRPHGHRTRRAARGRSRHAEPGAAGVADATATLALDILATCQPHGQSLGWSRGAGDSLCRITTSGLAGGRSMAGPDSKSSPMNGLPLWNGAQVAVDTTLVSPLTSSAEPRRLRGNTAGAALRAARRSKERTCPGPPLSPPDHAGICDATCIGAAMNVEQKGVPPKKKTGSSCSRRGPPAAAPPRSEGACTFTCQTMLACRPAEESPGTGDNTDDIADNIAGMALNSRLSQRTNCWK